ncbi:alpha/beta hydrolase [Herbiconiux sp. VKM Ac-2851]|uniref:alpha/beta hydrolase n=1 Tax=Herbiconiux sp. VKM Ac-2851 TaxID=2739025 RepID=UPI001565E11A|nr:alpha/beta fold hydrolase [Herbiconiux sp. VKM Ac-2851]NQX36083.1 alpha/beta fold hydrolase [Herbiconiux sp. VKM Ac-2851]
MSDTELRIDDSAVVWSVPREELSERLVDAPLVIVMHGRGSHENDLAQLLPMLPADAVYAFLRAPISGEPWGMGGWSWFPLDAPGVSSEAATEAAVAVLGWLDRVEAEYGAPRAIAAMGFSQGGMMSIQLLRMRVHRFAAAVNLSGASAPGSLPTDDELAAVRPPLFWGRDVGDPIIAPDAIARTAEFVPSRFRVVERLYPGIAHSISREELDDVSAFLRVTLGLEGMA